MKWILPPITYNLELITKVITTGDEPAGGTCCTPGCHEGCGGGGTDGGGG